MMKNFLAGFFAAVFLFCSAFNSSAECADNINGIISYKAKETGAKNAEGLAEKLAESAGAGVEWYVMSLHQTGEYDFSEYARSLDNYLSENRISGTEGIRCALGFIAANCESDYIDYAAENLIGSLGIMSFIWGLHLLNNGAESSAYTAESLAEKISEMMIDSGGFALYGGTADVDVTAMALCALAPYYDTSENVRRTIDMSLEFISSAQLESGGFSSYGAENCESAAQVVVALCALGIDPTADERFMKNGKSALEAVCSYALPSGTFAHLKGGDENDTATSQALQAFISYERLKSGKGSFFIFDEQEKFSLDELHDEISENRGGKTLNEIKTIVCISVIAVCAAGIVVTLLWPKKKKE